MAGRLGKFLRIGGLAALLLGFGANSAFTQMRAGAAYLKLLPGTRQQNLAGSVTAGLDQPYSLYANPAAAGILRHWQFSTSYNRWIAGLSNASLLTGFQFRPWQTRASDRINVAAAVSRQWLGQFDATGGSSAFIDASDWWASGTVGLPFYLSGHQVSLGATARYFQSNLASYQASALTFDFGFLYRSPRFWLKRSSDFRGIVSLGLAVNHLGKDLTFVSQATPLPRTWRAGLSANLGKHDGLQIQLLADLNQIRDEEAQWGLGAEFNNFLTLWPSLGKKWSRAFSLRTGYRLSDRQNSQIVSKFSVGLSFKIDDYGSSLRAHSGALVRNNSSVRSDAGFLNSSVFRNVYQGTFSWHPTGPEPFEFVESAHHSFQPGEPALESYWLDERVTFAWYPAHDPDLFDEVNYLVVLARERQQVQDKLTAITSGDTSAVTTRFLRQSIAATQQDSRANVTFLTQPDMTNGHSNGIATDAIRLALADLNGASVFVRTDSEAVACRLPRGLEPGDYHWALIAYDGNFHMRSAGGQESAIGRFHIKMRPDLTIEIDSIRVVSKDYVADLKLWDKNGTIAADDSFYVDAYADTLREFTNGATTLPVAADVVSRSPAISNASRVAVLPPGPYHISNGEPIVRTVSWPRELPHLNVAINDPPTVVEADSIFINNFAKDTLDWHDLRVSRRLQVETFELDARFAPSKSKVSFGARLELQRLAYAYNASALSNLCIKIDGHTDATPWKNRSRAASDARNRILSQQRADSVAQVLIANGVNPSRIITRGFGSGRPKAGARLAENRRVEIYTLGKLGTPPVNCTTAAAMTDTVKAANSGARANHSITVTNKQGLPAKGVLLTDAIPPGVQATDFWPRKPDKTEVLSDGSQRRIWRFDALQSGEAATVTFTTVSRLARFGARSLQFLSQATAETGFEYDDSDDRANTELVILGQPFSKHAVQCGDDLPYLANHYYGRRDADELIRAANRSHLRGGRRLSVGDTLTILNVVKNAPPPGTDAPPTVTNLAISGDLKEDSTIELTYQFNDGCDAEGASVIEWFRIENGKRRRVKRTIKSYGDNPRYTLTEADACRDLEVEVTPVTRGNQQGDPVRLGVGLVRHAGRCRSDHDCLCRAEQRY